MISWYQLNSKERMTELRSRSKRGAGIILAVVIVMLLASACALAVLLSVNTGVATYNNEKLGFIANQGATYIANFWPYLPTNQVRQDNVTSMVNGLMSNMGLNGNNTTVTIAYPMVNGTQNVSVTVTSSLPTITSGGFSSVIGQQMQATNTATVPMVAKPYATGYVIGQDPIGGGLVTGYLVSPDITNLNATIPTQNQTVWSIGLDGLHKVR